LTTLGAYLRALREAAGLTLRDVAARCAVSERCGVSNGYLSLLEQDKVRAPSPNVLWTLADCYGVDYAELLGRAGYPVPVLGDGACRHVALVGAERLTPEDREEIEAVIALKLRRRRAIDRAAAPSGSSLRRGCGTLVARSVASHS